MFSGVDERAGANRLQWKKGSFIGIYHATDDAWYWVCIYNVYIYISFNSFTVHYMVSYDIFIIVQIMASHISSPSYDQKQYWLIANWSENAKKNYKGNNFETDLSRIW